MTSDIDQIDSALTLDDEASLKLATATSKFLMRVSAVYGQTTPFLGADCAAKAVSLNFRLSKSKNSELSLQKMQKFRRSICARCKTPLIVGRTTTLSWQSAASYARRFGGQTRLAKIEKRQERGTPLTRCARRIYARYSKKSWSNRSPRLVITCSTCSKRTPVPVAKRTSNQLGNTSIQIGESNLERSSKKKRRKKRKDPTAGLKLGLDKDSIQPKDLVGSSSILKRQSIKNISISSTPRGNISTGGLNKKRLESKLEKLLAKEERKEKLPANVSALSSFLESL